MTKQSASQKLKESIRILELIQIEERNILKSQIIDTYESFKLVNILKSSMRDISGSVDLKSNLVETLLSVFTGYFTKKMIVSSKSNPFMKIFGFVLQLAVTGILTKNSDNIKAFVADLIEKIIPKENIQESIVTNHEK